MIKSYDAYIYIYAYIHICKLGFLYIYAKVYFIYIYTYINLIKYNIELIKKLQKAHFFKYTSHTFTNIALIASLPLNT